MNPDPTLLQKLAGLEGYLSSKIRGQGHVIPRVCSVLERGELGVRFQEVVHAKESWEDWVDEDPKHPTASNA
jgi:hypothetical protein